MINIKIVLSCVVMLLCSAFLTWMVRIYALKNMILDIPNERSSHHIPIPRGGGMAIIVTFFVSLIGLNLIGYIETNLFLALMVGGMIIAIIGYYDDAYSINARWRILLHSLAAAWTLYCLGGFFLLEVGTFRLNLHWTGPLLAIISIVACINFYNFMDGIDGLAGSEGIFVGLTSGIALWWIGEQHLAIVLWLLAFSIMGFTVWNWQPAKIFLGDVGSGFLGFIFSTVGLYTVNKGLLSLTFWWIVLAVFICDPLFTLIQRIYQGKKWYNPHREHAYQRLIFFGTKHHQVTLSILLFNCFMLLPAAFATFFWPAKSLWFMLGSTICLWLTWCWIKTKKVN